MSKRIETIRINIMVECYGVRPGARDAEQMAAGMRRNDDPSDVTAREVATEAAYLVGKGFLELAPYELAQGGKRWTITAAGVDYMEKQGWVLNGN